jgi:hypothetical protein
MMDRLAYGREGLGWEGTCAGVATKVAILVTNHRYVDSQNDNCDRETMKSNAWDDALLADHRSYIKDESTQIAFDTLVDAAIRMPDYNVEPAWHGELRDFRYNENTSTERPYAFSVAQEHLLFYVRKAGLRRVAGGFAALKRHFATATEKSNGEWAFRIRSVEDAARLNDFLFSTSVGAKDRNAGKVTKAFTQYWRNSEPHWREKEYRTLELAASNLFRARGVESGATVYIVTIINGRVHLGGALRVDSVIGLRAAQKRFGKDIWEATDYILARNPQMFNRGLVVPMSTVQALRFVGDKALVFKSPEQLDTQTLRGVRELTSESARMLEVLLEPRIRANEPPDSIRDRAFPNELDPTVRYIEGGRKQVLVNAFERDSKGREACVSHYGFNCAVCEFNFEDRYGERGKGFIHVHHLKPLALTDGEYEFDPITDLRPVCPNCHAMLHRGETVLSIEELRGRLSPGTPTVRKSV